MVSAIILGLSGLILFWLAEPKRGVSLPVVPWELVPVIFSAAFILVIYYFGTVNYASNKRLELRGATNLEGVLDRLSEYLEEGNRDILNAKITSPQEYLAWHASYKAWMEKVEGYLEKHLGLREKLKLSPHRCAGPATDAWIRFCAYSPLQYPGPEAADH